MNEIQKAIQNLDNSIQKLLNDEGIEIKILIKENGETSLQVLNGQGLLKDKKGRLTIANALISSGLGMRVQILSSGKGFKVMLDNLKECKELKEQLFNKWNEN